LAVAGVDDPHLRRDRYADIAGRPDRTAALRLGITHSPEPRVLDAFAADGYDLVLAGHTHGGQLSLPAYGPIVPNRHPHRPRAPLLTPIPRPASVPAALHSRFGASADVR